MKPQHLAISLMLSVGPTALTQPTAAPNTPQLARNYGKLPLSFEANQGQSDQQVRFLSRGNGYSLFLTSKSAVLALTRSNATTAQNKVRANKSGKAQKPIYPTTQTDVIRMELSGANPIIQIEGGDQLPGAVNYFIGNDPGKWHSNIPTFAKVKYRSVYPGVDLIYHGNQRQLEYDFVVQPQADPKRVKLRFADAKKLRINAAGDLVVEAKNGDIAFHKPVVYQVRDGQRQPIDGSFALLAKNTVAFRLGSYDRNSELVIDPTLAYSTYLGGSTSDYASAIAVDGEGNAYIAGYTESTDFPVTSGAFQTVNKAPNSSNAFVSKLNAAGSGLVYSTYLGGSGYGDYDGDQANAIAVDSAGNAYVSGSTYSSDFPVTSGAFQKANKASPGGTNAFVAKLDPAGSGLVYSTYLGGSAGDYGSAIAVDGDGNGYVAGSAYSTDFPVTSGAFQKVNKGAASYASNAFVTKLNPEGSGLDYSTYLGGSDYDYAAAIAVDGAGNGYVAGQANSTDFPVTAGTFQRVNHCKPNPYSCPNAFVTKLNPEGSGLAYSTYLGGSGGSEGHGDYANSIAVDGAGNGYVAGIEYSTDFPVTAAAFQKVNNAAAADQCNAFVTKLNPGGSGLVYSTYLGGSGEDYANGIALDGKGDAILTGIAYSTDFPVTGNAFQAANNGRDVLDNAFATVLNPSGSALVYSTYLGGSGGYRIVVTREGDMLYFYGDGGNGVAADSAGNAYLAGYAWSANFPVSSGTFQKTNNGFSKHTGTNAFVTKFALAGPTATTTTLISDGNPQKQGVKVTFTADVTGVAGSGTATGTVGFSIDGGAAIKVTLDDTGRAAYSTATLIAGVHKIVATYLGDATHLTSTSATLSETIYGPAATVAVVSGSPQSSTYGTAFAKPLVVIVKDSAGDAVPGATVTFSGTGLKLSSPTATTAANGEASVTATPTKAGSLTATATVAGVSKAATFALTATKAVLTVTANNVSVAYDQPIPALTDAITGFVNGDTSKVVTGTPTLTTTAKEGSAVGTYPITIAQGTLAATNYTFKFVKGTLTITSLGTVAAPTFSPAAGTYTSAQTVDIKDATAGAIIYFTTNGTTPNLTKWNAAHWPSSSEVPWFPEDIHGLRT